MGSTVFENLSPRSFQYVSNPNFTQQEPQTMTPFDLTFDLKKSDHVIIRQTTAE